MIIRYLFAFLLVTSIFACTGDQGNVASTAPATSPAPAAPPPVVYESIEIARLENLFANATYMDATFYDLPVSINQSELPQIQSTLSGVSSEPMPLDPACKPLGHIWFQINGKNIEEADIYFQQECVGYVWYENGKPAYSNKLTREGMNFYANILQSVEQQTGQQ